MLENMLTAPSGKLPFDAYMEIAGMPGESTESKHKGWVEIKGYRHQVSQKISASFSSGAPTGGDAEHGFFWVCKEFDSTSPKLQLALSKGDHIPDVKVDFCTQTGEKATFLTIKLTDVVVGALYTSDASFPAGTEGIAFTKPCEWLGWAYSRIEWTYTIMDPKTGASKGNVTSFWDRSDRTGG
ncbi:MAG: type VI secretion system tube protein Hcp [Planctomycetales bacterium]|nr:type VI secretion system tube protein Hcp [Planctomycetales bacterium]